MVNHKVKEANPIKQGLKLNYFVNNIHYSYIKEANPIKQGLKWNHTSNNMKLELINKSKVRKKTGKIYIRTTQCFFRRFYENKNIRINLLRLTKKSEVSLKTKFSNELSEKVEIRIF